MPGQLLLPSEPIQLPLLPLRDVVVFPHMVIPLFVGRPKSIKALEAAMETGKSVLLVAQKTAAKDEPSVDDLYDVGCIASILQMLKLPDGTVKVLVEGSQRAEVSQIEDALGYFSCEATPKAIDVLDAHETEALRRAIMAQFDQYVKLNKKIPQEILASLGALTTQVALPIPSARICP
jgi:ATP-dependent Lon protease